jgi:predicted O-methyltransferase YrrM
MDIVDPRIEAYTASLHSRYDEPVLLEMEAEASERGFPIVGRNVGVTLWLLAASIGAKRVFELGSGYGYSAYWFGKATGADGEIHLTDGDAANERKAADYLGRAGMWDRMRYHVGDALTSFATVEGDFDVVYDDIDKQGYPDAWRDGEPPDDVTDAIREHNAAIAADDLYVTTILPIRDGVLVACRTS